LAFWISFAAAQIFAIMALLSVFVGVCSQDMLCSAMHSSSPLSGMAPMYLLMSAFHLPPWLKLMSMVWTDSRASL
jgi:hypothetical protein